MSGLPSPVGMSVAGGCHPAGLSTEMRERTEVRRFDFGDGVREVSIEIRLEACP